MGGPQPDHTHKVSCFSACLVDCVYPPSRRLAHWQTSILWGIVRESTRKTGSSGAFEMIDHWSIDYLSTEYPTMGVLTMGVLTIWLSVDEYWSIDCWMIGLLTWLDDWVIEYRIIWVGLWSMAVYRLTLSVASDVYRVLGGLRYVGRCLDYAYDLWLVMYYWWRAGDV